MQMAMQSFVQGPLVTTKNYARCLQNGGEAHSIIRVQNLSTEALIGGAIWGIQSNDGHRNVLQPALVSSTLSLREPFRSAAQSDTVNSSTVNYSTLSKEILKVIASRRPDLPHSTEFQGLQHDWSLYELVAWIQIWLTGYSPSGSRAVGPLGSQSLDGECPCLVEKSDPAYKPPLLDIETFFELGLTLFLPKATLLSSGVSLSVSTSYFPGKAYRSVLKIQDIRIPTLIGINAKERLAKQLVTVSVEIDPYICQERDYYNELEQIIVKVRNPYGCRVLLTISKTTEESSFGTLESLATHLSARIIKYFIYAYTPYLRRPMEPFASTQSSNVFSNVRVCLEKPSAVIFADSPSIEIIRSSNPQEDRDAEKLWTECLKHAEGNDLQRAVIPYPLQGKLSAWIYDNCPDDST